ncbi:MAG TPA: S1C family serine protease [Polyangiaceae bacterium]|nr:S1C family serine protease [Polyangiaceae bacterium]
MSGSDSKLSARAVGVRAWGALLCGWLSSGCAAEAAEAAFQTDFNCARATATESAAAGRFRVHGCGRVATYQCVSTANGGACVIQTVDGDNAPRSTGRREGAQDMRRRPGVSAPPEAKVRLVTRGDEEVMLLELQLEEGVLRITASPDTHSDVIQLKLVRQTSDEDDDNCNLDWMLNGQVIATPKSVSTRKGRMLSQRVQISGDLIQDFGTAAKVAFRSCGSRFALDHEQVDKLRTFIERFQEELAWNAPPRSGSTGGMLAPSGGWPAWSANTEAPKAVAAPTLDAPALFKKLSGSVFQLEAKRAEGTNQGSAVAINPTELLTNCHVLQGALKLVLKQNKQQWPASIVRADPANDRCVVTAQGLNAQPVAGVRAYDSLEVGEPAYTLGSPVGLELTLSSGIVSGRRDTEKRSYVQTTAPISPGSSGGGLFDAHGNLIGITTLVMVGREHLNQSLNFAIPADAFWKP